MKLVDLSLTSYPHLYHKCRDQHEMIWLNDRIPSTTPGAEPPRDARILVQLGHIQRT